MIDPQLKKVYNNFDKQIVLNLSLVKSIEKLTNKENKKGLKQTDFFSVVELAFMKVYIAWETFLEESFILLMLGKNKKLVRYVTPTSKEHALEIIKEGRDYPEWTKIDVIFRKAKLFFKDGKPFKKFLGLIKSDIEDMTTIRNAIVHRSDSCKIKFEKLIRSNLGESPKEFTPGKFLLNLKLNKIDNSKITYLQYYLDRLKYAAKGIINSKKQNFIS